MIVWPLACTGDVEAPSRPMAVPPLDADGPVWTTPVVETPAVPPGADAVGLVQHRLCTGEGPYRERFAAEVRVDPPERRARHWELTMSPWCGSPTWCAWLGEQVEALPDGDGTPYWFGLRVCDDPVSAALFEARAPDDDYLLWADAHPGPFRPRVARIAERVLARGDLGRVGVALSALQATDGPEAERVLLALHRAAPPGLQDLVASHLGGREDARAHRLYRAACLGQVTEECTWERPDPLRSLVRAIELGVDADRLLERYPNHRTALLSALGRCTIEEAGTDPAMAATCAHALALADRAAARRAVEPVADADVALDELRAALESADRDALARRLEGLGFPALTVPDTPVVTARELLEAAGRAVPVDGGGWPPRHERMLHALADAAGLEDVAFGELLPSDAAPAIPGRTPRVALFAWLDGVRLRVLAEPEGGAWDEARAVALINAVLARRDHPERFAVADGRLVAVLGPPAALAALADEGLAAWAEPPLGWEELEALEAVELEEAE